MSFIKNIFGKSEEPIASYDDFWAWFEKNEKAFAKVVRERGDIEHEFFDKVTPKLNQLVDGLFLLTGGRESIELVFTPDGNIKKIVFAEELVGAAPHIEGWTFLALKPDMGDGFNLKMGPYDVSIGNLHFYSKESWEHPDEIAITVVHDDLNEENRDALTNAVYIFLDNSLGELAFATTIDDLKVIGKNDLNGDLVPIENLRKYLADRELKFVEKYEGSRFSTDDDSFSIMEGELESGAPLIAVANTTLLMWDRKPSHPWVAGIAFEYADTGDNGMPDEPTYKLLGDIEEEILSELKDSDGYLNVGRETSKCVRTVYFACKDFRRPSKVFDRLKKKYSGKYSIDFDVYKDKYWQSFDRFVPTEGTEAA
jgi:uncharacterized protein DUF695